MTAFEPRPNSTLVRKRRLRVPAWDANVTNGERIEKARRARLRKAAGLKRFSELYAERQQRDQELGPSRIRRSAFLVSYACFACRKSFKKPFVPDRRYKCPQCARDMAHLGRSFKAPRKTEKQQWEKVHRLWSAGYRFHTNTRRQDVPAFPEQLRDVDEWISQNPRHPFRLREFWPKN